MELKAVKGRDGHLFLGGEGLFDVMGQMSGAVSASHNGMVVWAYNIDSRKKLATHYGFKSINVLCPEPHVFNREFLPTGAYVSGFRPITLLLSLFKNDIFYPLVQMEARKGLIATEYSKVDTHWTQVGAYTAYCLVMGELGLSKQTVALERCEVVRRETTGDLGCLVSPEVTGMEYDLDIKDTQSTLVYCNEMLGGCIQRYLNPNGVGKLLIFGSSFSTLWTKFFAESFAELVYVYSTNPDEYLIKLFTPDYVLYETPERFAVYPQSDAFGFRSIYAYMAQFAAGSFKMSYCDTDDHFVCGLQSLYQSIDSKGEIPCPDSPVDIKAVWSFLQLEDSHYIFLVDSTYNLSANYKLFCDVDAGVLTVDTLYRLPCTSPVMLARIRVLLKDGRFIEAFEWVKQYRAVYGHSPELDWFARYLAAVIANTPELTGRYI